MTDAHRSIGFYFGKEKVSEMTGDAFWDEAKESVEFCKTIVSELETVNNNYLSKYNQIKSI
jgi:hypothetical protein